MSTPHSTLETLRPADDPIDVVVPPLRPWWQRLPLALAIIGVVGVVGWAWHFGALRPSPDCCGSGSSSAHMVRAERPGAVTVTAYFFNSSPRALTITGADADLPGATVLEIAPFADEMGIGMLPEDLGSFPYTVEGTTHAWFAITFEPDRCDGPIAETTDRAWGSLTLDLSVAGDPWYPTLDRRFILPDPLVPAGFGQLSVLPSEPFDEAFDGSEPPIEVACTLLGR